jgi:hypothetical protein
VRNRGRDRVTVPPIPTETERRHTKAERSAETRIKLMDATLEFLSEMDWAGTSTTEVVRRAGLSRGAQEYRTALQNLPNHERTGSAAFDLLRAQCSGPMMDAWLELAVAARTDPALKARFKPSIQGPTP